MTNEQKLINAINEIHSATAKGLKAQLMRGDRDLSTCWNIAIAISDRIIRHCNRALKEVSNES